MSPEQKKKFKEKLQAQIGKIRSALSEVKKKITANAKNESSNVRASSSNILKAARQKSKEKYESDLDTAYARIKG